MNAFALQLVKKALTVPKTRQELLKETNLPERTLRYNLNVLKKKRLVEERFVLGDLRRKIFVLKVFEER